MISRRLLLLSVIRPSIEYESEVWEGNKSQAGSLQSIILGGSSSASFVACVEKCISERGSRKFEEGLNIKVNVEIYKRFGKSVEFKRYLHGIYNAGSKLLLKFRSHTHRMNEDLGRHRGRECKAE